MLIDTSEHNYDIMIKIMTNNFIWHEKMKRGNNENLLTYNSYNPLLKIKS